MTISKTFTPQINTSDLESTAFAGEGVLEAGWD